jgi:hypothetical protein
MTTIIIPTELEAKMAEAAKREGTTLERLAVESLQRIYAAPTESGASPNGGTLADFLQGYVGTVSGSKEAWSVQTGERLTDMLLGERHRDPS